MKLNLILALLLGFKTMDAQIPKGYYFQDIEETIWTSEPLAESNIIETRKILLSILEVPVDSVSANVTLWCFNDSLSIKEFDGIAKTQSELYTLTYSFDDARKELVLEGDELNVDELRFNYTSVATGRAVLLSKKKSKK